MPEFRRVCRVFETHHYCGAGASRRLDAPDVQVRRALLKGVIKFDSRSIRIGRAFSGEPVGVRPAPTAGLYEVFYAHQTLGRFDVSQTPRGSPEVLNIHRVLRE